LSYRTSVFFSLWTFFTNSLLKGLVLKIGSDVQSASNRLSYPFSPSWSSGPTPRWHWDSSPVFSARDPPSPSFPSNPFVWYAPEVNGPLSPDPASFFFGRTVAGPWARSLFFNVGGSFPGLSFLGGSTFYQVARRGPSPSGGFVSSPLPSVAAAPLLAVYHRISLRFHSVTQFFQLPPGWPQCFSVGVVCEP